MDKRLIEKVVTEQKEELAHLSQKHFCTRREESLIDLNSKLAQVIIGVRRSGKSTLCYHVLKKAKVHFAYINFDDERLVSLQGSDLDSVLEVLYKIYGNFSCLFIDEIQNISEWFLFVNRLLRQEIRILVTGSNAKLLSGELATHLTGRYSQIELYPFSFSEYCEYKHLDVQTLTTRNEGFIREAFDEYLKKGGFPELFNEKNSTGYINALVNSILTRDILTRYSIKYETAFTQIANHVLNNVPFKVSYKELQNHFNLKSDHTVMNYMTYLKRAYLLAELHKYSAKSKIRVRDEKVYAIDVALMNNRLNAFAGQNLGWRLETAVYLELLRRYRPLQYDIYYYSTSYTESDFVVCQGNQAKMILQVSYDISNEKTRKRELMGLEAASRETRCETLLLITDHEREEVTFKEKKIRIVPAYEWLLEENEVRE